LVIVPTPSVRETFKAYPGIMCLRLGVDTPERE
jgi:hypothetical protein